VSGTDIHQPEPDRDRLAMITIDTQRDTLPGGACEIAGTDAVLAPMDRALRAVRARDDLIVHVVRLYREDGSNAEPVRRALIERSGPMLAPGTDGSQLCKEIQPGIFDELDHALLLSGGLQELGANEFAMYKPRWGAFYETDLERLLRACNVTTLVFAGANWPNCPRASIYEASERDFRVIVLADAVSGLYDRGVTELGGIGAWVADTDAFLAWYRDERPLAEVAAS